MPWISNRTDHDITVSITNTSGGSHSSFNVKPAVLYQTTVAAAPECSSRNYWSRKAAETLTVTMPSSKIPGSSQTFTVQPNDHVNIYTDSYEAYPVTVGWLK
jgi:hypothetical protein